MKLENESHLREHYVHPRGRAKEKVLPALEKHAINFIEHSPFLVMSTFDAAGNVDTSPRGGQPGFVMVSSVNEVVIPDAKGNNRLDSMQNILETGRIGTLFLVPGIDETLRINGRAKVVTTPQLLAQFPETRNTVKSCIVIDVEEVFLHCAKALMRSKLWTAEAQVDKKSFPSIGQMLKDQLNLSGEPESRDDMARRYEPDL